MTEPVDARTTNGSKGIDSGPALAARSGALRVQVLEEVVGGQLDLLVAPFGGTELAGDQAHPVDAPEVAVDERVAALRLIGRPVGEAQVPGRVVVPGVGREEPVLVLGARLGFAPVALEDVLAASISRRACSTAAGFSL